MSLKSGQSIRTDARFRAANNILSEMLDEELVILDLTKGEYYGLNRLGAQVWNMLGTGMNFEEMISTLCDQYDVPRERITQDVMKLLDDLVTQGLIVEDRP